MAKKLPDGVFKLTLHAYCGMHIPLVERGTMDECRKRSARRLRYSRDALELPVETLDRGREWELMTPDDAIMISDNEGILSIEEVTATCGECEEAVNIAFMSDGLCDSCRDMFDNSDYEPMSQTDLDALDYLD